MRATLLLFLLALPVAAAPSAAQSTRAALETRRLDLHAKKLPLPKFLDYVREATGLNIVLKRNVVAKKIDPDSIEITLTLHDVRAVDVLDLALAPYGLTYRIQRNIVLITTEADARGAPVLVLYDLSELLMPIRDFPAPDINLHPSKYQPPEAPEPQVSQPFQSASDVAALIQQFTGKGTWDLKGVKITPLRHALLIRQYPSVHRQIARLLAALHEFR